MDGGIKGQKEERKKGKKGGRTGRQEGKSKGPQSRKNNPQNNVRDDRDIGICSLLIMKLKKKSLSGKYLK